MHQDDSRAGCTGPAAGHSLTPEITEADERLFAAITSTELDEAARARITAPAMVQPTQEAVLAVHWHPEYVPMELIRRRIEATYPAMRTQLIIPTQHNELLEYGP
ncbi:MAG: hypothetical protein Q8S17_05135, partial [Humidesulfovibrio sp.]|nr:hypothetical protein [Humidesulfovibrio sp.]